MSKSTKTVKDFVLPARADGSYVLDAAAFSGLGGRHFAGLNIVNVEVGQAAGPFTLIEILKDQNLQKKKKLKKGEKPNLVDIYIADFNGTTIRMPASASFVMKAKESKLKVGDIFAIKRNQNYKNDFGNESSKSWELKVISSK